MTVDELRWYSRRKPSYLGSARDNLCVESGSLKDITSEYGYSFRPPAMMARSLVNLAGHEEDDKENLNMRRCLSHSEDLVGKSVGRTSHRVRLQPQGDLRPEGEMLFQTEKRDQFIEYVLSKRPDLLRRETQLKLEGELNTVTENKDKFIFFENCTRPPLAKRLSNLHLEGDFLHFPEYNDVFIDFPRHRPVIKKPEVSWLHDKSNEKMDAFSETFSQYIEHAIPGVKPEILKRPGNLKCEGDLDFMAEYAKSYTKFPIERRPSLRQSSNLKLEGELYTNPEYRDKYIGLPIVKLGSSKHADSLKLDDHLLGSEIKADSGYVPSPSHADTSLPINPEVSLPVSTGNVTERPPMARRPVSPQIFTSDLRSYLDNHKVPAAGNQRPKSSRKSPRPSEDRVTSRPPRGRPSRRNSQTLPSTRPEQEVISKKENKQDNMYRDYVTLKGSPRLKSPDLMGAGEDFGFNFEGQPEYRKAYTDYLIRERLPRHRSPENVEHKPPVNLKWIKRGENNRDRPFEIMYGKDKPREEKQVGSMKDENVYHYQPSSRRASINSNHSPRRRSDSPSYRLHVTNVDEPKKGFGQNTTTRKMNRGYQNSDWKPSSPTRISQPMKKNVPTNDWSALPKASERKQWTKNNSVNQASDSTSYNRSFVVLDKNIQLNPVQYPTYKNTNNSSNSRWYRQSND